MRRFPFSSRAGYLSLALATIALGLVVHLSATPMNPAVRDILGDALWAMMISWFMGAIAPRVALRMRAVVAFGICAAVEVSQLVHAPALDSVRETTLGHLVLGSGFDPRDFVAYGAGVAAALLVERTTGPSSGSRSP